MNAFYSQIINYFRNENGTFCLLIDKMFRGNLFNYEPSIFG